MQQSSGVTRESFVTSVNFGIIVVVCIWIWLSIDTQMTHVTVQGTFFLPYLTPTLTVDVSAYRVTVYSIMIVKQMMYL